MRVLETGRETDIVAGGSGGGPKGGSKANVETGPKAVNTPYGSAVEFSDGTKAIYLPLNARASGDGDISFWARLFGGTVHGEGETKTSKSSAAMCAKGSTSCEAVPTETTKGKDKSSDNSDGSNVEDLADNGAQAMDQLGNDLGNFENFAGGDFGSDFGGGFGSDFGGGFGGDFGGGFGGGGGANFGGSALHMELA